MAVVRAGKDGQSQSQVISYQYDALGRRIAKTDSFGTTHFTWDGMRLLQESRGQHTTTYVYEPGSYVPLARIDGAGAVRTHPAAAHALSAGGDASEGKQASIPTTNPGWSDRFNAGVAANDGSTNTPATAHAKTAATATQTAQVYYFHTQPNGLPERTERQLRPPGGLRNTARGAARFGRNSGATTKREDLFSSSNSSQRT